VRRERFEKPDRTDVVSADLGRFLEGVHRKYARPEYLETDPLPIVRRFRSPEDRETVGLLTALLSYGRVSAIRTHVEEVLAPMGGSPALFVRGFDLRRDAGPFLGLRYRFHAGRDLVSVLAALGALLRTHGGLENLFLGRGGDTRSRLSGFVREFRRAAPAGARTGALADSPGLRFLLPSPDAGGACKRWNLFLRWMVRPDDGIDCGVWSSVAPAELVAPLDTHLSRIGRRLGLLESRAASWAAAERLTRGLRRFDARDPTRFDFPLCRLGILDRCPESGSTVHCLGCELLDPCRRVAQGSAKKYDTLYEKS
jgi:uncharacterized protein (TIGR02757 family)